MQVVTEIHSKDQKNLVSTLNLKLYLINVQRFIVFSIDLPSEEAVVLTGTNFFPVKSI